MAFSDKSVFNTTKLISGSFADMVAQCYITGVEWYEWGLHKYNLFEGEENDLMAAFLQNILGNVMTVNKLYEKITEVT